MSLQARALTDVRPLRGLRFDPARVDPQEVVAPPYDVIDAARRESLMARSPYNVVRLSLPTPGEEATADELIDRWLDEGVLIREAEPSLYWLEQDYVGPDGVARRRAGLVANLRLDPYGEGGVRPHERTMAGPKANRLALMRATRANLSPIFGIYDDPERRATRAVQASIEGQEPVLEARDDDGTTHRLWRVPGEDVAAEVAAAFADTHVVIADGHHRYETALTYRAERRADEGDPSGEQPYDFAPTYLANTADPGVELFPTHRVVVGLEPALWDELADGLARRFDVEEVAGDAEALYAELAARPHDRRAFGLWRGQGTPGLLLTLPDQADLDAALPGASPATRALDVAAVGALVLDEALGIDAAAVAAGNRIRYRRSADQAGRLVDEEAPRTAAALLLRAPTLDQVEAVAAAGETMPQKSTYFYPKILDGMVFHPLAER